MVRRVHIYRTTKKERKIMANGFVVGDWVASIEEWGVDNEDVVAYRVESVNNDGSVTVCDSDGCYHRLDTRYIERLDVDYIPGFDDGEAI